MNRVQTGAIQSPPRPDLARPHPPAAAFWERVGYEAIGRLDGGVTLFEKRLGG